MNVPAVNALHTGDEAQAVDTIVLAFANDPITRWLWPGSQQYLASMAPFTKVFGCGAFTQNGAFGTADFGGVCLWLAPGERPDEQALVAVLERTIARPNHDAAFSMFEQMGKYHPTEPHWYLPLIGCDPAYQGKGYGSALLARALAQCDRDHLPAYLEATNERNTALYQRHGFERMGTIQAGNSPPLVPMYRKKS